MVSSTSHTGRRLRRRLAPRHDERTLAAPRDEDFFEVGARLRRRPLRVTFEPVSISASSSLANNMLTPAAASRNTSGVTRASGPTEQTSTDVVTPRDFARSSAAVPIGSASLRRAGCIPTGAGDQGVISEHRQDAVPRELIVDAAIGHHCALSVVATRRRPRRRWSCHRSSCGVTPELLEFVNELSPAKSLPTTPT